MNLERILREVLAKDKSLLCRRDELIAELERRVPGNLRRDFVPIRKALSLNIGEKFFVGEADKNATKQEAAEILKSSGMQAARIDFVIETFANALDWYKPLIPAEGSTLEENFTAPEESVHASKVNTIKAAHAEPEENFTAPEKSVYVSKVNTIKAVHVEPEEFNILSEFNNLTSLNGYETKLARDNFISKYKVKFFKCANYEARMSEPIPAPEFIETETIIDGDYWAIPLKDNLFAVLPGIKTYTENHHTRRAMGEVFKSNFVKGNTYKEITVEEPAIFEFTGSAWILKRQGALNLDKPEPIKHEEPVLQESSRVKEARPQNDHQQENRPTVQHNDKGKIFTLTGRLNRLAYFLQTLKIIGIMFIGVLFDAYKHETIGGLIFLVALIGSCAISVRRLHDLDKSGWWLLVGFIPYIDIVFGLYLLFAPGTKGYNRYGADPLTE